LNAGEKHLQVVGKGDVVKGKIEEKQQVSTAQRGKVIGKGAIG